MKTPHFRSLTRRSFLLGSAALSGLTASALYFQPYGTAARASRLVATPGQTEGPFYPIDWSGDIDSDLVQVKGAAADALGQVLHLHGRVFDLTGRPLPGTAIEIWQCDSKGVYRHPRDEGGRRQRDTGFQGRGRAVTDENGRYTFRTIRPVAYPGRTPHIHVRVTPPKGRQLSTQMYVKGEPLNERDWLLNAIRDKDRRDSVLVALSSADRLESGALTGTFDIVVR